MLSLALIAQYIHTLQLMKKGKVVIGYNARIGSHTTIMPGITIGENAIVGANSFVTKDIPKNTFFAGCPAKLIKELYE